MYSKDDVPKWIETEIRADEKTKTIEEIKSRFTRKDEDGNLYIFAWYDELKEQEK